MSDGDPAQATEPLPVRVDPSVLETIGATPGAILRRRIRAAVIAVVVIGVLALAVVMYSRSRIPEPVRYETAAATRQDLTVEVVATGTLEPRNTVEVGAEISGRVEDVHADFNDRVERDQVLITLDGDSLRAAVRQAQAQLQSAHASLRTSETNLREATSRVDRAHRLTGPGALSGQEVETLEAAKERAAAAVDGARAQVAIARASLATARENVDKATIRSPITGVVLSRSVEPGQTLAAAFTTPVLFLLAEDLSQMELHVDVDEADIGRVADGMEATFTVDAFPDRTFPADVQIVRNTPRTIQNVVTYGAVLSVDNPEFLLRPGMTATATVTSEVRREVLVVPNAALRFHPPTDVDDDDDQATRGRVGGDQQVWVLVDGEPEAVDVRVGPSDGSLTELVGGELSAGDEVIVDLERSESRGLP